MLFIVFSLILKSTLEIIDQGGGQTNALDLIVFRNSHKKYFFQQGEVRKH